MFFLTATAATLMAGIVLLMKKGWGWNFAVFYSCYSLVWGVIKFTSYFVINDETLAPLKGLAGIAISTVVLTYLMKARIRAMFDNSHVSLFLIGFFLMSYGFYQHSGNSFIDTFWAFIGIIGLAVIAKGGKQLRKPYIT